MFQESKRNPRALPQRRCNNKSQSLLWVLHSERLHTFCHLNPVETCEVGTSFSTCILRSETDVQSMLITVGKPYSWPRVGDRTKLSVIRGAAGLGRGLRATHADRSRPLQKPPVDILHGSDSMIYVMIIITGDPTAYQSIKKRVVCSWEIFHFITELKR